MSETSPSEENGAASPPALRPARIGGFVADRAAHLQAERHIARTLPVYPDKPPITSQKGRQP